MRYCGVKSLRIKLDPCIKISEWVPVLSKQTPVRTVYYKSLFCLQL